MPTTPTKEVKKLPRKTVTVNLIDVQPIADELKLCRMEIARSNALLELFLINQNIAVRVEEARPSDLKDTSTEYGADPEFVEFIERMEADAGRKLSEGEARKVYETWKTLDSETA